MQVTIFGASGKVGRLVTARMLMRKYTVVAFVHSSEFTPHASLRVIRGDISDRRPVREALVGSETVISVLGSWRGPQKNVLTAGMSNIIPAMQSLGIRRIVSLTGADAQVDGDQITGLHRISHAALGIIAGQVLYDGENHIRLLRESDLDWTVLRSPVMLPFQGTNYRLGSRRPAPWATVNRHAVAMAMADELNDQSHLKQSPFISR